MPCISTTSTCSGRTAAWRITRRYNAPWACSPGYVIEPAPALQFREAPGPQFLKPILRDILETAILYNTWEIRNMLIYKERSTRFSNMYVTGLSIRSVSVCDMSFLGFYWIDIQACNFADTDVSVISVSRHEESGSLPLRSHSSRKIVVSWCIYM